MILSGLPWYTRLSFSIASGLALALSFPNFDMALLAWVAIALLLVATAGARPRLAFLCGLVQGLVFAPISLIWFDNVIREYGNVDPWSAAGVMALISLAMALFPALLALLFAVAYKRSAPLACAFAAFLWVALELLRDHLPIFGFPWNLLGYAVSGNLAFLQLTTVAGIYGLSFLVAGYNALLAYAVLSARHRSWQAAITATGLLVLFGFGGGYFVPVTPARHIAHLVQTNFEQEEQYPGNWAEIHSRDLDDLQHLSVAAAMKQPGLIVWPEVPAPFSMSDPSFVARAKAIAHDSGVDFLVGVEDWKPKGPNRLVATNSAVLLNPAGERLYGYDKIHLVPFGEYVPLRRFLGFAGKIVADIGDFTPGAAYNVGRIRNEGFATYICYEAIFPEVPRRFTLNGANLLINISNDGWFGRSAAPAQHLMMARVRAVENRRWLLRDTNNGYTVSVDPYGRIVAEMPTDVRGELDAPYDFRNGLTPYTRFGDWFAWLCVAGSAVLFGFALFAGRAETPNLKT